MKVYEEVLDYLKSAGVKHFAGMVGSTAAPYVVGVAADQDLRYIPVRHAVQRTGAAQASAGSGVP